jgi:two-component system OmpR family response regulator
VVAISDGMIGNTLILVEDDAIARESLTLFLSAHNHVVHTLCSGAGLLDAVKTLNPDAVIMDFHLPGDNGANLVKRLRQTSDVPVIMFTADDDIKRHVDSLNCGADAFLIKGVDMNVLNATVRRLIKRTSNTDAQDTHGWQLRSDTWYLYAPDGASVRLTAGEFYLLSALAEMAPDVVSRDHILKAQGKMDTLSNLRNLDVYVTRLRTKALECTGIELPVKSIYASGFAFTEALKVI